MKKPLSPAEIAGLAAAAGLSPRGIVNTRSPAYRKLKLESLDDDHATALVAAEPRLMIRPALAAVGGRAVFGFDEGAFEKLAQG